MGTSDERNVPTLAERLASLVRADPMLMLGLLYVLTKEQWDSIVDGNAYRGLVADLTRAAAGPLRRWELDVPTHAGDVGGEVLLKLSLGRFLKCYRPARKHPRAYLLGCARQMSRVEARSIGRRYRREGQQQ